MDFNKQAKSTFPVTAIGVHYGTLFNQHENPDMYAKLVGLDDGLKLSGMRIGREDVSGNMHLDIILDTENLSFNLKRAGQRYPLEKDGINLEYLTKPTRDKIRITENAALHPAFKKVLNDNLATAIIDHLKHEKFTFENEDIARAMFRDIASIWLEERLQRQSADQNLAGKPPEPS